MEFTTPTEDLLARLIEWHAVTGPVTANLPVEAAELPSGPGRVPPARPGTALDLRAVLVLGPCRRWFRAQRERRRL